MAQEMQAPVPAPPPVRPGAGRGAVLSRDPGRATEQLYRRHGTTVFRFAWHLLDRREDAEDATQATFLAVYRSLGGGAAVLEPRAWVMRIARNECMSRLRQTTRTPGLDQLEGVDVPAPGGVEQSAELRDEVRVARVTLAGLPDAEREAFVLHEWIGLETREVALALGVSTSAVDDLSARARRSLVLAVGGLEPAAGCGSTRAALESGTLGRATKVHLLRCPACKGVRRALRPPEETLGRAVPLGVVAERLADAVPGFATGGGIVAALAAKVAAAPIAAKTAAALGAALLTIGTAREVVPVARHAVAARGGAARPVASPVRTRQAVAHVAPPVTVPAAAVVLSTTRTGGSTTRVEDGTGESTAGGRSSQGGRAATAGERGHDGSNGVRERTHEGGRGASRGHGSNGGDSPKTTTTSKDDGGAKGGDAPKTITTPKEDGGSKNGDASGGHGVSGSDGAAIGRVQAIRVPTSGDGGSGSGGGGGGGDSGSAGGGTGSGSGGAVGSGGSGGGGSITPAADAAPAADG